MKKVNSDKAPKAVGPYSQAIISNGFVFSAGQIGLMPETGELAGRDIEAQTIQVIQNLSEVLEAAGSSLVKVIKTTCYLKSMDDFKKFNEIYEKYFTENPARATVEVSALPKNALIEIDVVAEINQ